MSDPKSILAAYVASPEFQAIESGELLWGDLVPPLPPSPPTRDFSALAPRAGRNAFASLNRRREAAAQPAELGPEPSVPGWRPSECAVYLCPGCDGAFQCYCFEQDDDAHSYESERDAYTVYGDCTGCYPGCFGCQRDFDPADPWGDGAPEEHPGHPAYDDYYGED
jgi:hypothetical protein